MAPVVVMQQLHTHTHTLLQSVVRDAELVLSRGVTGSYSRDEELKPSPPHWDAEDAGAASFCIAAVPRVCAMNS